MSVLFFERSLSPLFSSVSFPQPLEEKFEELRKVHRRLLEQRQQTRLTAAAQSVELEELAEAILSAVEDECTNLVEFQELLGLGAFGCL